MKGIGEQERHRPRITVAELELNGSSVTTNCSKSDHKRQQMPPRMAVVGARGRSAADAILWASFYLLFFFSIYIFYFQIRSFGNIKRLSKISSLILIPILSLHLTSKQFIYYDFHFELVNIALSFSLSLSFNSK